MRMKKGWIPMALGLVLAMGMITTVALAQPMAPPAKAGMGRMGMGPRTGFGPEAMMEQLGLSEEQQAKLQELRLKHQQQQVVLRGEIDAAEARLEALLLDPEAQRKEVLKAGSVVSELRSKLQAQRLAHRMDVRALLTPEQRAQLVQWKAMHHRRGHGGDWGCRGERGPRGSGHGHAYRRGRGPAMRGMGPMNPPVLQEEDEEI